MISDDTHLSNQDVIKDNCWKFSYLTTIATIIIEFFQSNIIFMFLYLNYKENISQGQEQAIWIPIIYVSTWKFSNPVVRKICEKTEMFESKQKYIFIVSSILLCVSCILPNFFNVTLVSFSCYGILAGIAISLMENQLDVCCFDEFQSNLTVLKNIKHLSNAFGLFFITLAINYLIVVYKMKECVSLIAFVITFVFIGINGLILGRKKHYKTYAVHSYSTCEHLDNKSLEFVEMNAMYINESMSESSFSAHTIEDNNEDDFIDNSERIVNKSGVEILPQIKEESDGGSEEFKNEDFVNYCNFQLQNSTSEAQEITNSPSFTDVKYRKSYGCCLSPYTKYKCKKNFRIFCYILYDNVFKPLYVSLKSIQFYSILITKTTNLLISCIFFFKAFYLITDVKIPTLMFYLPLIAFGQLTHCLLLPWCSDMSKMKLKVVFGICMICNAAIFAEGFIEMQNFANSYYLTLGNCILFGFTNGFFTYHEERLYKHIIGIQQWKYARQNLEIFSAILICILYFIINDFYCDVFRSNSKYFCILFVLQISSCLFCFFINLFANFLNIINLYMHKFHERHLTVLTNEEISYI